MGTPILAITDGTTKVNLLTKTGAGINTCEYTPSRQIFKNDGIWADSSVADGRQLQMRKWTNIIDVLSLVISGDSQDSVIENARRLTTLLEKAVQYWTTEWQNEPVWLERRGSNETNTSYTLIHSYKWANDDNPFAPPFYVTEKPFSMKDIDLALEHGPWLANAPGESECVEISNLMTGVQTTVTASPTAQNDDCSVEMFGSVINLIGTDLDIGEDWPNELHWAGIRFTNITVPAGATIISAHLKLTSARNCWGNQFVIRLKGESNAAPAQFSTAADFNGRVRTANAIDWNVDPNLWFAGTQYISPDIKDVIQEITDLGGWASGNNLALFCEAQLFVPWPITYKVYAASFDHPTLAAPVLEITFSVGGESGRTATCDDEVYLVNKDNQYQITDLYHYDASLGNFTDIYGAALPKELFPNPVGNGDMLYIGCAYGVFSNVVFDLSVANDGNITWEYSQGGGAWAALTIAEDIVDMDELKTMGVGCLVWRQPIDWAPDNPVGAPPNAYWIRAKLTTLPTTIAEQDHREVYTILRSSIDIDEDQIAGDITAIAKVNLTPLINDTTDENPEKIIISTRSVERGENFIQHINTNGQNNGDITVALHDLTANQNYLDAPTGAVVRTAWAGNQVMTLELDFTIDPPLANQYYGRYRAFIRGIDYSSSISEGDIKSYLNVSLGSSRASKIANNIDIGEDWYYFDYGIITIPPAIIPEIYQGSVLIEVYASNDAGAIDFDWVDLILVPVDEYALELRRESISSTYELITLDSISYLGKANVFSIIRDKSIDEITEIPNIIAPSEFKLQANKDIRLYMFAPIKAKYNMVGRIQIWDNERYLTLRGDS